jgi:1,4-dihydroxy-2-naphthoyl-CoA hydrolase
MSADQVDRSIPLSDVGRGFLHLLGVEISAAGADRVELSLQVGPQHLQPHGVLHGGVHCTLVETAASIGGQEWMAGRGTVVGVSNHTNFLRPFSSGRLTAVATPIHRGRSQQLWLVELHDDAAKLIGRGEVRLHNLPTDG